MELPDPVNQQLRWAFLSASWTPYAAAAAATAAAVLATVPLIPGTRRRLLHPPTQPSFRSACPFLEVLPDGRTVKCRGNRIMRAWRLAGTDHSTMPAAARLAAYHGRCATLDSLSESSLSLRFVTVRLPTKYRPASADSLPADISAPVAEMLRAWSDSFDSQSTFRNRHWLLAYGADSKASRAAMDRLSERLSSSMAEYDPQILSCDPAASLAEPMTALLAPTAPHTPAITPGTPLHEMLCTASFAFDRGRFRFRSSGHQLHLLPMGIRALPDRMSEDTIARLLRIPAPLILHHLVHPVPKARAILDLARLRATRRAFSLGGVGASNEITEAISVIEGSHPETESGNLFVHQTCILAGARSESGLSDTAALVNGALAPSGAAAVTEGFAARNCYWSAFPTIDTPHRPFRLLTPHLASWILPQTTPSGLDTSDWADRPIAIFRSAERTPYRFHWHVSEEPEAVPHCMVIAPTGSGKTTLLSFLTANTLTLHDSQVWLFDRFNGAEIFVRAAGGDYLRFEGDSAIRMNPLLLDDTQANRAFLRSWICSLIPEATPEDRDDVAELVRVAYDSLPPSRRSLAALYKGALRPGSAARHYLAQWVMPDQFGHVFNAPVDNATEGLSSRLTAFDCTTVFDNPELAAPLISYLSHRIRALSAATARPSLVYIDETAAMLRTPQFRSIFEAGLREGRKQRQAYVCAFQDPAAIAESGIGHVLRGQCQTAILMRNLQARPDDYRDLELTETEFAFVSGRSHRDLAHAILLKRYPTGETTIIDTSLKPLGPYLRLFASGNRNVQQLRGLTARMGREKAIREYLAG